MLQQFKYWVKRHILRKRFSVSDYWESRYARGGNSGKGSYAHLADHKAEVINSFIQEQNINSIIELGCGDGNQLALFKCNHYIGLDVSPTIIEACKKKFVDESGKEFHLYSEDWFAENPIKVDLSLSLDVIYHLTNETEYEAYLNHLFDMSKKHVLIYATNYNSKPWETATHMRHHKFTDFVERELPNWKLLKQLKNKYPVEELGFEKGSIADFYIFEKF